MKHLLYIVGEPGVGKSTLAAAITAGAEVVMECKQPLLHRHYRNGVTELGGKREGGFPGTDALPMNVQHVAEDFLCDPTCSDLVLAEGDRLANDGFLHEAQRQGYQVHIFGLIGERVAARRRLARGSDQSPTWVDGRRTKVRNLLERWGGASSVADASLPVETLLACLLDPVSRAFRS